MTDRNHLDKVPDHTVDRARYKLKGGKPTTIAELAGVMCCSTSYATTIVNRLMREGEIELCDPTVVQRSKHRAGTKRVYFRLKECRELNS